MDRTMSKISLKISSMVSKILNWVDIPQQKNCIIASKRKSKTAILHYLKEKYQTDNIHGPRPT